MADRRPKCNARLLSRQSGHDTHVLLSGKGWILAGRAEAHFGQDAWLECMRILIWHPEQTSSSILRADILEHTIDANAGTESIFRKLLPRRPSLDKALEQDCCILLHSGLVTMTPRLPNDAPSDVPYYHPSVRSIAFKYTDRTIDVYVRPFDDDRAFDAALQPQHRLSRTVLSLLDVQAKIGWGCENGYKKRVEHDMIVERDAYHGLYLRLREKYASMLIKSWVESTDPGKHVFEDLGIAAFLILLWQQMNTDERPSLFVDVGCGNGLLVYLLTAEGYSGYGMDVQERKSWTLWRQLDKSTDLRVEALDAPWMCGSQTNAFLARSFLIGNHADELTPWLPLLAHRTDRCAGFVNIPCCRFALDGQAFGQSKYRIDDDEIKMLVGSVSFEQTMKQVARGPLAEENSTSRNIAYLRYIAHLHLQAGWQLEKEALRIPSTKNWAFIGRKRSSEMAMVEENVRRLLAQAHHSWKARVSPLPCSKDQH